MDIMLKIVLFESRPWNILLSADSNFPEEPN